MSDKKKVPAMKTAPVNNKIVSSKTVATGGSGSSEKVEVVKLAKVTKIMLWPSRKINLGNYNTVELNAGIELTFDEPVEMNDIRVQKSLEEARKVIRSEFLKQYAPYRAEYQKGKQK